MPLVVVILWLVSFVVASAVVGVVVVIGDVAAAVVIVATVAVLVFDRPTSVESANWMDFSAAHATVVCSSRLVE